MPQCGSLPKPRLYSKFLKSWGGVEALRFVAEGGPIFWRGVASLLFNRPRNKPPASMTFNSDRVIRQLFPLLRQVQVHLPDVGVWGREGGTLALEGFGIRSCA